MTPPPIASCKLDVSRIEGILILEEGVFGDTFGAFPGGYLDVPEKG